MEAIECVCTECRKHFQVAFHDGAAHDADLDIDCDPGGVYSIAIVCPHCRYAHVLF